MRRAPAAAVLLLLAAGAAAAAPGAAPATLEFGTPAGFQADLAASGLEWAILVFQGPQAAAFGFGLEPSGTATNHTHLELRADQEPVADRSKLPVSLPPATSQLGPVAGTASFGKAWGSLVVLADHLSLQATAANGTLRRVHAGTAVDEPLAAHAPYWTYRSAGHAVPSEGAALSLSEGATAFELTASGAIRLEWHNATVECSTAECLDGGGYVPIGRGSAAASAWQRTYTEAAFASGTLQGSGQAFLVAAGGPSVDARLDGWTRLPRAHGEVCGGEPCEDPAGRTFRAEGAVALGGLQPVPGSEDRLAAAYDGELDAAAFDEAPVRLTAAQGVAAGAVAVVGLGLLAKLLLALFARKTRPVLEHPRTKALHDAVCAEPGLSHSDLKRRLGWGNGNLTYHLRRLLKEGLVVAQGHRNTVRFFENHGRYDESWKGVAVLRKPEARALHQWVLSNPDASQGAAVRHAGDAWQWTRSRTLRTLALLQEARLVAAARRGRGLHYTALAATPAPAQDAAIA